MVSVTKEQLEKWYFEKHLSMTDIGEIVEADKTTIRYWFKKYGIQTKNRNDAAQDSWDAGNRSRIGRGGELHPNWKHGKSTRKDGYVVIGHNKIFEHRRIMEQHLGRKLGKDEVVHHVSGDRSDNRIENLQLMTQSTHTAMHSSGRGKAIDTNKVQELKSAGKTVREICKILGICETTYRNKKLHRLPDCPNCGAEIEREGA